jgi:5-oxopent-3-ene-1,2,5-tricarboxylate decarboxylase/2-hydroxyhepta-2,4-diene-1,7-dioate isomerase
VSSGIRPMSLPEPGRNTVYGAALNYRSTLEALGSALTAKPYNAPPRAPVLYIKPANTWIGDGDPIPVPADVPAVQAGVTLAALIGRDMQRVDPARALSFLAGFTVVNDVTVPHTDFFRPMIQNRCRDGFCAIARTVVAPEHVATLGELRMRVWVNGELACSESTNGLVRPVAQLLADMSTLFTLAAGDLVLVGAAPGSPLVHPGDHVALEIDGVGRLENPVVAAANGAAAA